MKLVALTGYKRSGKNTAGGFIANHYEGIVYQIGFADKVKITAAKALGLEGSPRELIASMDEAKEEWMIDILRERVQVERIRSLTGREYVQNVGEAARELFGGAFWVNQVLPNPCNRSAFSDELLRQTNNLELGGFYPEVDLVAFTDLRLPVEAGRVLALDGEVWRVNRPGCEPDDHHTEQPLPDHLVSRELHNTSDLEHLSSQVYSALDNLR